MKVYPKSIVLIIFQCTRYFTALAQRDTLSNFALSMHTLFVVHLLAIPGPESVVVNIWPTCTYITRIPNCLYLVIT